MNSPLRRLCSSALSITIFLAIAVTQTIAQTADTGPTTTAPTTTAPGAPQIKTSNIQDRVQSRDRNAPIRENGQAIKIVDHVNALFSGLAHGSGFPFGIELTTANSIPGIELRAKALLSTKLYRRFEGEAYFPKVFGENTHASAWFSYTHRTKDNFYGIGPRTSDILETNFSSIERAYNFSIFHDFAKGVQAGIYARVSNTSGFRGEDDNDTPVDVLFSGNPATLPVTRFVPGLNTNVKLFSYGAFAEFDLRDNSRGLPKGGYFYGRLASFDGLKNGNAFADFGWTEAELDGRAYIPIFSDYTSLALRVETVLKNPKSGSQIPFYNLAEFGGRSYGRGFHSFRFRANNSLLLIVEPRQTVWKRDEDTGLDVFAFGDGGQVWGDNRSRTNPLVLANDKFASQNWRFGVGGGMQYRLSKGFAARIELGRSNESTLVYFSVGRGF